MSRSLWRADLTCLILILNLSAGCVPRLCLVDSRPIEVDPRGVPDQSRGGCYRVSIERHYANATELELILRAESLASTVGPSWFRDGWTPTPSFGLAYPPIPVVLFPEALNSKALVYYANRMHSLQMGAYPEINDGELRYYAHVVSPTDTDPNGTTTILMVLDYFEQWGFTLFPGFMGISARREVTFDQNQNVIEIRYDGEAGKPVA